MGRLDILHDFILETIPQEKTAQYEDCLLLDLYLRENSKSRPQWACDIAKKKPQVQEFYRQESEEKRYLTDYEGYSWKQIANMTHLEILSDGQWCLFDYKKRNPLTKDAAMYVVLHEKAKQSGEMGKEV